MNRRFVYAVLIVIIVFLFGTYWYLGEDTSPSTIARVRTSLLVAGLVGVITLVYKHWKFTELQREIDSEPDKQKKMLKRSIDKLENDEVPLASDNILDEIDAD